MTSILSMIKGKTAKSRLVATMMGKAMYRPMSKPSVPPSPELLGVNPPKDAALISSSDASHPFIFSSREDILVGATASSVVADGASSPAAARVVKVVGALLPLGMWAPR